MCTEQAKLFSLAIALAFLFLRGDTCQAAQAKLQCHTIKNNTSSDKTDYHIEVNAGNEILGVGKGDFAVAGHRDTIADWSGSHAFEPGSMAKIYIKTEREYDPKEGTWTPLSRRSIVIGHNADFSGEDVILVLTNNTEGVELVNLTGINIYTNVPSVDLPTADGPFESFPDPRAGWNHQVVDATGTIEVTPLRFNLGALAPNTTYVAYFDYEAEPADPGPFDSSSTVGKRKHMKKGDLRAHFGRMALRFGASLKD
ncbi:MAG: hypothetical protein MI919_13270, partial [Holophagales bacterium]|nr:hypothetical protein [Holophagales bacterium]